MNCPKCNQELSYNSKEGEYTVYHCESCHPYAKVFMCFFKFVDGSWFQRRYDRGFSDPPKPDDWIQISSSKPFKRKVASAKLIGVQEVFQ